MAKNEKTKVNTKTTTNKDTEKTSSHKDRSVIQRSSTLLTTDTPFSIVESYKTARTNIMFSLGVSKGCKKIIVTSAAPGEGKTTTVINLAIAFAQMNSKVLVMDGDLRKPRLYRHLKLERKNGLSDVLCDMIDLEDAIHHCEEQGIDCITSGQIPPNPAELLASDTMANLLDRLSEMYDYIFIDTPPVNIVSEAAVMAKFANGVIIVARQNYTVHESLMRARENLLFANAKILGYILNDVSTEKYGYGRYYYSRYNNYYNYNYNYQYSYGDNYQNYGNGYGYGYSYGEKPRKKDDNTGDEDPEMFIKKDSFIKRLRQRLREKLR